MHTDPVVKWSHSAMEVNLVMHVLFVLVINCPGMPYILQ